MTEARTSPWVRNVVLLVGFLILVVIGIFTVVLPEIEEADAPEQPAPAAASPSEQAQEP